MRSVHGGARQRTLTFIVAFAALGAGWVSPAAAQSTSPRLDNPLGIPDLRQVAPPAADREGVSATLKIVVVLTLLTLAPSLLIMTTSFMRIVIVLGLLRQALATPQLPPSQTLVGLSLFMTFLVMTPTFQKIHEEALAPYLNNEPGMTQGKALEIGARHIREFMFNQIEHTGNEESIYVFQEYAVGHGIPEDQVLRREEIKTTVLIPAFMISELKTAFVMGFRVYLPFLVIDMVISSILISMGMMMLPPVLISLPFKILLFVMVDGWELVVGTLLGSFV